jgi:hypothetical protein
MSDRASTKNSHHRGARHVFFPPLVKGGPGGGRRLLSNPGGFRNRCRLVSRIELVLRTKRQSLRVLGGLCAHPPLPPLHKGGKGKAPALPCMLPAIG